MLQSYAAQISALRAPNASTTDLVYVNGQYTPVLEMGPGEVQLWRIVNATSGTSLPLNGPANSASAPGLKWIQTAQDGVQLHPENYQLGVNIAQKTPGTWTNATLTTPMVAPLGSATSRQGIAWICWCKRRRPVRSRSRLARADAALHRQGDRKCAVQNHCLPPPQTEFPPMPKFLDDLSFQDVHIHRELHFKSTSGKRRRSGFHDSADPDYRW